MLPHLPPEICDKIIAFLDADQDHRKKHLAKTSLVSQAWYAFSRDRFFTPCPIFSFTPPDSVESLLTGLGSWPGSEKEVDREVAWMHSLATAPEASKRATQIDIRSWPASNSRGAIRNIIERLSETFTEVKVLRIDLKHGIMPTSEAAALIQSCPRVCFVEICIMRHREHGFPGQHLSAHFPGSIHHFWRDTDPIPQSAKHLTIETQGDYRGFADILRSSTLAPYIVLRTLDICNAGISPLEESNWRFTLRCLREMTTLKTLRLKDTSLKCPEDYHFTNSAGSAIECSSLKHLEIHVTSRTSPCIGTMLKALLLGAPLRSLISLKMAFDDLPVMMREDWTKYQCFKPFGPVHLRRKRKFARGVIHSSTRRSLQDVELVFEPNMSLEIVDSSEFLELFGEKVNLVMDTSNQEMELL